jgi:hypothetical protein
MRLNPTVGPLKFEVPNMTKSDIIYHYTTVSGLIGIVTHRELWVSDCRFLNDGTELTYAEDIFFSEIKKLDLPTISDAGYRIAGPSLSNFRMFLACFCEEGDLLSQWRGYGIDQGYSLGFDTSQLKALEIGEISPVQYGITKPSEYFADELSVATEPTAHPGVEEWHASMWLLPRLVRVKHPGFAEEREWRLFIQVPSYDRRDKITKIQIRPSPLGPVPYLAISFPPNCIREIVIGPGSHTETREAAVRDMLKYLDYSDVDVRISKIPLRN